MIAACASLTFHAWSSRGRAGSAGTLDPGAAAAGTARPGDGPVGSGAAAPGAWRPRDLRPLPARMETTLPTSLDRSDGAAPTDARIDAERGARRVLHRGYARRNDGTRQRTVVPAPRA